MLVVGPSMLGPVTMRQGSAIAARGPNTCVFKPDLAARRLMIRREIRKPRLLTEKSELHQPGGTVALLGENQFGGAVRFGRLVVLLIHLLAEDEDDDVRILFERA